MAAGPSTLFRFTHTCSALPALNTILGDTTAVTFSRLPSCSMTQFALCGGRRNLASSLDMEVTSVARLTSRSTEQRASPNPQLSLLESASLMDDLAHVLVSVHLRLSPAGFLLTRIWHKRRSEALMAASSPRCSSRAQAAGTENMAAGAMPAMAMMEERFRGGVMPAKPGSRSTSIARVGLCPH